MTMPLAKLDLLAGYGAGLRAGRRAAGRTRLDAVAFWLLDLHVAGVKWGVFLLAIMNGIFGTSFGLFFSAFVGSSSRRSTG